MADERAAPAPAYGGQSEPGRRAGPSRRAVLARLGLLVGVMVVVFVVVLPRIVDYGAVAAALSTLSATQLVALAAATGLAYVVTALPARILIPGLSWSHAIGADLAGRAVASTIPGPTDVATRYVLYRQWAIPADTATAGIVFYAFFETLSDLVLPLIATIGVLVSGHVPPPTVVLLSVLGVVVLAVVTVLMVAIVRSESLAGRVGRAIDALAHRLSRLVRRTPPSGIVPRVMRIRVRAHDMLSRRGVLAYAAAVLARLAWFLVLEVALWSVGVTWEVLPPSAVLTAMAAVAIVALIPITPGAVGVSEIAYVALLSAVATDGLIAPITAAIVIFRTAQWLVPIPLGWILLVVMRGSHWRELDADGDAPTFEARVEAADA